MSYQDEIRRRAAQGFAPGWQPQRGDELLGVVEDVDHMATSKFGEYDVITVRRIVNDRITEERLAIHAFHTSLKTSMQRKWPNPGGVLYVKYEGTKHNDRTDQDFESYLYVYDSNPPEHLRLAGYSGAAQPVSRTGAPAQQDRPTSNYRNEEPF